MARLCPRSGIADVNAHFGVGIANGICFQVAKEHPDVGQLMLKVEMV